MNRNGQGVLPRAPSDLTCCSCGKPIGFEQEDKLIELVEGRWSRESTMIRWHQDCFNQYLDEGEET